MKSSHSTGADKCAEFNPIDTLNCGSVSLGSGYEAAYASAPFEPPASGDFHAAFPLEDGSVGVVIGDVVGHGEEASRHAERLCRAIAECLIEGLPPEEALGFVNAAAEMSPYFEGFATVFAGLVFPDGSVHYASGGHEPAMIAKGADDTAERMAAAAAGVPARRTPEVTELINTGPPLGVLGADEVSYERGTATISQGSTLFLYTDGITEARRGRRGPQLGMDRLKTLLMRWATLFPLRLVCKVLGYARAFAGRDGFLRDDAALLALRRSRSRV